MNPASRTTTVDVGGAARLIATPQPIRTEATLDPAARVLAEAARGFHAAVPAGGDATELARAFEHVERALDDLAASAELAAHAVIERATPGSGAMTRAAPAARSMSWRLHALRTQLIAAREISAEVSCAAQTVTPD